MHLFVSVELFSNYLIRNLALNAKTSNMSVSRDLIETSAYF